MPLKEVQAVLARLYTDSGFRDRFFGNPIEACREYGLSADDAKQLEALDRPQIERFARSLRSKRAGLIREQLPALMTALGDAFWKLFQTYCEQHPSVPEP